MGIAMYWNVVRALQSRSRLTGLEFALVACLISIVLVGLIDLWQMVGGWR